MTSGERFFVLRRWRAGCKRGGRLKLCIILMMCINIQHIDCYFIKGIQSSFPLPLLVFIFPMMRMLLCADNSHSDLKSMYSLWYLGDRLFPWVSYLRPERYSPPPSPNIVTNLPFQIPVSEVKNWNSNYRNCIGEMFFKIIIKVLLLFIKYLRVSEKQWNTIYFNVWSTINCDVT